MIDVAKHVHEFSRIGSQEGSRCLFIQRHDLNPTSLQCELKVNNGCQIVKMIHRGRGSIKGVTEASLMLLL